MFSIADLLSRAKAGAGIDSDYRLAKVIGISHQSITGYRTKNTLPNERVIEELCALSGDDPDLIAAQIQAARSQTEDARALWQRVAARLMMAAPTAILSVIFAMGLIAAPSDVARAGAAYVSQIDRVNLLYIVSITFLSLCGWWWLRNEFLPLCSALNKSRPLF